MVQRDEEVNCSYPSKKSHAEISELSHLDGVLRIVPKRDQREVTHHGGSKKSEGEDSKNNSYFPLLIVEHRERAQGNRNEKQRSTDRKSTRLNSSHQIISYAVFCLK